MPIAARPYALTRDDRSRLRALVRKLGEVASIESAETPAPRWLAPALGQLLRCDKILISRPAYETGIWRLGDRTTTDQALFSAYDARLSESSISFNFDPLRPEAKQRNRVSTRDEIHVHGPDATCAVEDVWPKVGLGGFDQVRALVCDGSVLLAWVGGMREEPFTPRERRLFSALVPALTKALALRRRLIDGGLASAGLAAALDAVGAPAFLADGEGRVIHASTSGKRLADRAPAAVRSRLRDAISQPAPTSLVARLDGASSRFLVVLREGHGALAERLLAVAASWGVTARELDVLRGLVSGDANKEIALKLRIHEGSVERHVTSLLRKARCDSRSRLVALFWTDA